jgi:TolA-binding protein
LAEIHSDLGEWQQAIRALRDLEIRLRTLDEPPREPAMARIGIYNMQRRAGADPDSIRANLLSVLNDYPDSRSASQALMALALEANERDQVDEAVGYLDRMISAKTTNEATASQVLLAKGRLLDSRGRWPQALEVFRTLSAEHLVSEAGLAAPLEIATHYRRAGDDEALKASLSQAEQQYRDFIAGYPESPYSAVAREQLVQTFALQQNYSAAVEELVSLGEGLNRTPQGGVLLVRAAGMAARDLGDTARAVTILDRVHELYAEEAVGNWAADEAGRLRGMITQ